MLGQLAGLPSHPPPPGQCTVCSQGYGPLLYDLFQGLWHKGVIWGAGQTSSRYLGTYLGLASWRDKKQREGKVKTEKESHLVLVYLSIVFIVFRRRSRWSKFGLQPRVDMYY